MEFNENIRRSSRNKINIESVEAKSVKSSVTNDTHRNDTHRIQEAEVSALKDQLKNSDLKLLSSNLEKSKIRNIEYKVDNINTDSENEILNGSIGSKEEESDNDVQIENCKKIYAGNNHIVNSSLSKLNQSEIKPNEYEMTSDSEDVYLEDNTGLIDGTDDCDFENLSTEAMHESGSEDCDELISGLEDYIALQRSPNFEETSSRSSNLRNIDENIRMIIFGDIDETSEEKEKSSTDFRINTPNSDECSKLPGFDISIETDNDKNIKKSKFIDIAKNAKKEVNNFFYQDNKISKENEIEQQTKVSHTNIEPKNSVTSEELKNTDQLEMHKYNNEIDIDCQKKILDEKIIKSADIYISVEKQLTLHCKLCLKRFNELKLYKEHIHNKHESNKTEAADITETRSKFLSSNFNLFDYNDDLNIIANNNMFKMPIGQIIWEAHLDKFKYECSRCSNMYDEFEELIEHKNCIKEYQEINEIVESIKPSSKINDKETKIVEPDVKAEPKNIYINDGGANDERWDKLTFSEIMELINKYIGIPDISLETDDILKLEPRDDRKFPNDKSVNPDNLDEQERKAIFPCQMCGKLYTCRTILREHVRIHTGDKIHQCEKCKKGFLRYKYLDAHKLLFHSNPNDDDVPDASIIRDNISKDSKSYQCRYCERLLSNKSIFEDHLKVHYGVEPFHCQFCELLFIRKRIQASHEFQIHDDKFLKCGICNRQFDNLTSFQEHKKTHIINKSEQLICNFCNEQFPTKQKLAYHNKVHKVGNRFKCSECEKVCGNQYILDQHLRKHNIIKDGSNKMIKCNECENEFQTYKDLRLHQRIHELPGEDGEKLFKCKYCSLSFQAAKKLSYHERLHKAGNTFECDHCKKCFANNWSLQQHLLTHGIGTPIKKFKPRINNLIDDSLSILNLPLGEFKCNYCGLKFKTQKKVYYHELRHKVGDKFECKYCSKHFTSANALDQHCRKHLNNVQAFVCSNCPAKFSLKETRDLHETFHIKKHKLWRKPIRDNKYTFECNYCVKYFATDKCLEKHIARFHMDLDMYKFKCTYENCSKRFDKERKRVFHERLHVAGKKFKCNLCPKLCYDENTLKQHLRRHGQESDFKCKHCPATFNFKHTRTFHEKLKHLSTTKSKYKKSTKLKPKFLIKFACNLCEKSFSSEIMLKRHKMKYHEAIKYYECCLKFFTSKLNLQRHKRTHLNNKFFRCKICKKSFKTKPFLKLHNTKKHSVFLNEYLEECKICNLLFEPTEFIKHRNAIHSDDLSHSYKCLNCDKKFVTFGLLRVHRLTHINLFKCDFCPSGFRSEKLLRQHLLTHRIEKKPELSNGKQTVKVIFTCPICQKKFHSFQWMLLSHMEKKHQQQIFRCQEKDYCKRSFLTEAELIEHKRSHLGARIEITSEDQKPYKCDICDKRFMYEAFMKSHIDKFHDSLTPKCIICLKKFNSEEDFIKHKPICTKNKESKRIQCPYCPEKKFTLENILNIHLHKAHNTEIYKCLYCRQNYLKPEKLEDHIKNHHIDDLIIKNSKDSKPFKCEFDNCNNKFISSIFLNNHLSKVHNVIIYRCEYCKKGYREEKYFKEHKLTHILSYRAKDVDDASKLLAENTVTIKDSSTKAEELDDLSFAENINFEIKTENIQDEKQNENIQNEIRGESDIKFDINEPIDNIRESIEKKPEDESQVLEKLFSAVVDDYDYKDDDLENKSILKHLLCASNENEPSTSNYVPEDSGAKSVSLVDSLRTYRKKPSNDQNTSFVEIRERKQSLEALRPFKCQECDKSFVLDIYLINHVTKIHGADALANLNLIDARQIADNTNIETNDDKIPLEHRLSSEELRQFECDACAKIFSNLNLLKVHKKLHAAKPFKCNECRAEFATQEKYNEHEELHQHEMQGKRVFKCDNCEKLFPNASKLRVHEKSHSDERPFSCDLCPLTFKSKGHFFDHKRSHTGEKPFECRYCPERFPRANYRLKHERKHPEFMDDKKQKKNIYN